MLLRVVIGLGAVLVLLGFGAAGVQHWQTGRAAPEAGGAAQVADASVAPAQTWLISPTGGVVPRADVRAFLVQDRFVDSRTVFVTRSARLSDLLLDGEVLPDAAYLQVLADIRAPRVAGSICAVLLETIAATCAANRARVVEGSVDPIAGTARFGIEFVYTLDASAGVLPDLGAHVLMMDTVGLEVEAGTNDARTPEALVGRAVSNALAACNAVRGGKVCRVMGLDTTWFDNGSGAARATIGWLSPLPKGLEAAPPLGTSGG